MKSSLRQTTPLILVLALTGACGAQFGTSGKNKKKSDSDQGVIRMICLEDSETCVALSCEDIIALDDAGHITGEVRSRYEDVIAQCRHRGSSHDLEPEDAADDCPSQSE